MAGKVKRLSKVAREFNVGISTIVDFVASKGHEVESSPNAKIDADLYEIIAQEYESDANLKKKSEKASKKKEIRETVSIKDKEPEEVVEETVVEEPVVEETTPVPAEEVVEEAPAVEAEAPVVEEPVEEKPEEKEEPVAEEPAKEPESSEEDAGDIKVLGKIDLDKINPKTRPTKKSKEQKQAEKKASIKIAKEHQEAAKKEKAAEEKKAAIKAEAEKKPAPKVEIETIKAQTQKLSGPTVVGKIELPKEKSKSSSDDKKRKRKRIKKVNVDKQANFDKKKGGNNHSNNNNKRKKGPKKEAPTEEEIQKEIKETLARLSGRGKSKSVKNRREKRQNVAQRIEALTDYFGVDILASKEVVRAASEQNHFAHRTIDNVVLKGKSTSIEIVEIYQHMNAEQIAMRDESQTVIDEGIRLRNNNDFDAAIAIFKKGQKANPNDLVYRHHIDTCTALQHERRWDGNIRL